eukprot:jgi/Mesvir1/10246/Mv08566-RA.1
MHHHEIVRGETDHELEFVLRRGQRRDRRKKSAIVERSSSRRAFQPGRKDQNVSLIAPLLTASGSMTASCPDFFHSCSTSGGTPPVRPPGSPSSGKRRRISPPR